MTVPAIDILLFGANVPAGGSNSSTLLSLTPMSFPPVNRILLSRTPVAWVGRQKTAKPSRTRRSAGRMFL